MLAQRRIKQWQNEYGAGGAYRFETDSQRRITFATGLCPTDHQSMVSMLQSQSDQMAKALFESPPDQHVLIALPTPAHAAKMFADPHIHGNYQHRSGILIANDAGSALRHEFVHVFHHSHMDRLGQQHPMWVQEGLASLYEEYELGEDGSIVFTPNERRNIAKMMARESSLIAWKLFFALTDEQFAQERARHYAQARSIFEFLADQGRLTAWYLAFTEQFDDDPTGAQAMISVFNQTLDEVEQQWRAWLEAQPTIVLQRHVIIGPRGITAPAH
jgi:hypothetical protein